MKILLLEDNFGDSRLIEEYFRESGVENIILIKTETIKLTLEKLETGKFDAIIMDLSVPDSEVKNTFKTVYEKSNSTPIIILSGLKDSNIIRKIIDDGAEDVLLKGQFDPTILVRTLYYAVIKGHYKKILKILITNQEKIQTKLSEIEINLERLSVHTNLLEENLLKQLSEEVEALKKIDEVENLKGIIENLENIARGQGGS